MKEVVAICVTLSLFVITITLGVQKHLDWKYGSAVLIVTILLGLAIANYDVVSKLKMGGLEVETIRTIEEVKSNAIDEINTQGEILKTLVRQGNDVAKSLEEQQANLEQALHSAREQEARVRFNELKVRANEGSRKAFEELKSLLGSATGEERNEIELAIRSVYLNHGANALYVPRPREYVKPDGSVVQLEQVPLEVIMKEWDSLDGYGRKSLLDALYRKNDKNAIPFVLDKLKDESDLYVCQAAIQCLTALTGKRCGVLDFDFWLTGEFEKTPSLP